MTDITKELVNPYARADTRKDLQTSGPTMEGSLFTRRKDQVTDASEVVPKEYVDQFIGAPIASLFQPYIVGNYYSGNLLGGYGSNRYDVPRPIGMLEWFSLSRTYNFDRLSARSTNATNVLGKPAIYRMSEQTLLPVSLYAVFGVFVFNGGGTIVNMDLSSTLTLSRGLWGLYMQYEGGTGTCDMDASLGNGSLLYGPQPVGQEVDALSNALTPAVYNGFRLNRNNSDIVAGVMPDPSLFRYDHLAGDGSGLFLRRAA
jgi:hypothetical protein